MFSEISNCRVCKGELEDIGSLGEQYINDFPSKWPHSGSKCPLELVSCKRCSLLQLKHTVPPKILYKGEYWYKSGINEVIVNDLREIVEKAIEITPLKKGDTFLDIGANDGTLLSFVPKDAWRVAVEPARNLREECEKHCDILYDNFWEELELPYKAKIITAIGMFYDSEDPNKFIFNVRKHLAPNGLFIAQLMTLKPMIENNDVGNICHEHLEYYSYKSLVELFERNGLSIVKVEENGINGGSYRLFAKHLYKGMAGSGDLPMSYPLTEPEFDYQRFFERIEKNKNYVVDFIKKCNEGGEKVYAYGASTKGNSILQYYGLGADQIRGVADVNKEKWGKFTLTGIPIVSEEEARKKANWFLILPWGFTDMFVEREKEWLEEGGKFIVGIPEFKII